MQSTSSDASWCFRFHDKAIIQEVLSAQEVYIQKFCSISPTETSEREQDDSALPPVGGHYQFRSDMPHCYTNFSLYRTIRVV